MLETPSILRYWRAGRTSFVRAGSDNAGVRTISREVAVPLSQAVPLTPQRLHAELLETSVSGARAYLHGAAHDATVSRHHRTVRFGQADERWLEVLKFLIDRLGRRSWVSAWRPRKRGLLEVRFVTEQRG
jgi:hypothetical protein